MIACAWTDAPPPWELVRAKICQEFYKLPSEVDNEEADDLLQTWRILKLYESYWHKRPENQPRRGRRR